MWKGSLSFVSLLPDSAGNSRGVDTPFKEDAKVADE